MNMRVSVLRVCALSVPVSILFGQVVYNSVPSRIVGQAVLQQTLQPTATAINLVEGRELNSPQAVAVDTSVSPPILYVADTVNNRILAWKNATGFKNGAFADLVIGQPDMYSTGPQGPGFAIEAGFVSPVAVAVDSSGNLYVADAGHNRILRFPQPFNQPTGALTPDVVIGQTDLSGVNPDQGNTTPSATSICLAADGNVFLSGLTFDSAGNLYASDPCNNRVLRFPKSVLQSGTFAPAANLVLGQSTFATGTLPAGGLNPTQKNYLAEPSAIAIDNEGRVYVADAVNRVVVFGPPTANGQSAVRIMGVDTTPNHAPILADSLSSPNGIAIVGDSPYVVDTGNNRILGYLPFGQWPAEASSFSPPANVVIGQGASYSTGSPNDGGVQASASSVSSPVGAVWTGSVLLVADSGNNRVLSFPLASGSVATSATGVLGQIDFPYDAPNLIEGREFEFFIGNASVNGVTVPYPGGAVLIDPATNHMFVSDPGNNRILGFADYTKVTAGSTADIVIGQPDFFHKVVNYPASTTETRNGQVIGVPGNTGLWAPEGLALDGGGNLWVADSGNSRVLRFPAPFAQSGQITANLVLGQAAFTSSSPEPTAATMSAPYGVAITASGQVVVSDIAYNRVLLFVKPSGGDFTNGEAATGVIGQANYFSTGAGSAASNGLNGPRLMATDALDNLYVADTGNNRVAVYGSASTPAVNPSASFSLTGLNNPVGASVSSATGQIWVADTGANQVLQYPAFSQLVANPTPIAGVNCAEPLAVTFDALGNPVIAESVFNRVSFFYPTMRAQSAASYFFRYAPGMLASLFNQGTAMFGSQMAQSSTLPLPTSLGGVQVLVGGVAAPLLYVSPTQINFQIPMATALGNVEFDVVQAGTGQILTSGLFDVQATSPALFTTNDSGIGQVAALNPDGTVNSATNPIKAGQNIQLYGTGQGVVAGAPPDGSPTTEPTPTAETPSVYINGPDFLTPSQIQYSGLAVGYVGVWEIQAQVPSNAAPGAVQVLVGLGGFYSSIDTLNNHILTTIYVSQ